MRILLHDYSGHPFQAQLSHRLAQRGHEVVHSYCAAYVSGKGHLEAAPGESWTAEPIGEGVVIDKTGFRKRFVQELGFGLELVRQVRRRRPEVVMLANTPIPTLVVVALALRLTGVPWVLWHQDVQAVAIRSFAGEKLSGAFRAVAAVIGLAERWCARQAAAVVVITEGFLDVHRRWRTDHKTVVIPNWAPLDEIVPMPRDNPWAQEHGLVGRSVLLYSGTLGLKHDPALLPALARAVTDRGHDVELVVVNEGPAAPVVAREAERLGVSYRLLPFQPYERLSEVLGTGDVLVVLLESSAGVFSVPSKTLSYLSAGRPVLGLMPAENTAARLVTEAGGCVLEPGEHSIGPAADWVSGLLADRARREALGAQSRRLAERDFGLAECADAFEEILVGAGGPGRETPVHDVTTASAG